MERDSLYPKGDGILFKSTLGFEPKGFRTKKTGILFFVYAFHAVY